MNVCIHTITTCTVHFSWTKVAWHTHTHFHACTYIFRYVCLPSNKWNRKKRASNKNPFGAYLCISWFMWHCSEWMLFPLFSAEHIECFAEHYNKLNYVRWNKNLQLFNTKRCIYRISIFVAPLDTLITTISCFDVTILGSRQAQVQTATTTENLLTLSILNWLTAQ